MITYQLGYPIEIKQKMSSSSWLCYFYLSNGKIQVFSVELDSLNGEPWGTGYDQQAKPLVSPWLFGCSISTWFNTLSHVWQSRIWWLGTWVCQNIMDAAWHNIHSMWQSGNNTAVLLELIFLLCLSACFNLASAPPSLIMVMLGLSIVTRS